MCSFKYSMKKLSNTLLISMWNCFTMLFLTYCNNFADFVTMLDLNNPSVEEYDEVFTHETLDIEPFIGQCFCSFQEAYVFHRKLCYASRFYSSRVYFEVLDHKNCWILYFIWDVMKNFELHIQFQVPIFAVVY